jgi:OFA family oxalate/formate antiporter-like MFS transporter
VELYPDRSGWASGMTTAAFGAAAILWAPLVTSLITGVGDLSKALIIIGSGLIVLLVAVSSRLIAVPANFHENFKRNLTIETPDQYYNVNRGQMVHLPIFYMFLVSFALALSSGNALLAQGAYYMEALLHTSAESAALTVSAMALANMLGRIFCGTVADRVGKLNTVLVAQIVSAVALVACARLSNPLGFTIAAMVVIFCFGGMFSLLPPLNGEIFGHKHMTENFTIIFAISYNFCSR